MAKDIFDIPTKEYQWPSSGDRLLTGVGVWRAEASLEGWSQSYDAFVWSFRNAASTLVKSVTDGQQHASRIAWPLLYLYRHAVELALKGCILEASELLGESLKLPQHHRLTDLSALLLKQFAQLGLPVDDESTLGFVTVLEDLNQFDPHGTSFRYPFDKRGEPYQMPTRHINVTDLQNGAEKLLNYLECVSQEFESRTIVWPDQIME